MPDPVAPNEWVREYPGYLPGTGWSDAASILVRDGQTGEPLEGVLVRQHDEADLTREGTWAPVLAEIRTDEYGIAWMAMAERPGTAHWVVLADGYAEATVFGRRINEVLDLERGRTVRTRILGLDGNPAVGVRVGYKIGCAHAPILRTVKTDERGIATFRGVVRDGDYPYQHDGLAVAYAYSKDDAYLPPFVSYATPGALIEGRILLADGRPAAGA